MYEHRLQPLLAPAAFARRMALHGLTAGGLVLVSLAIGACGYHFLAKLAWIDALLNASMILTGMGPVDPLRTTTAKLFASAYALFSGVIFLGAVSVVLAPPLHRMMHRFHLERQRESGEGD
jgi:hypothetical protein